MSRNQSIFLQALVLSFMGHAIFFSIFIVEDIDIRGEPDHISLTMLMGDKWITRSIEAGTTSNPDAIDPELVRLAEISRRTVSPKLEAHRKAVLWEEEVTTKSIDPDIISWLMWSFRREKLEYAGLFDAFPLLPGEYSFLESDISTMEERIRDALRAKSTDVITSSFKHRKLVYSPLPSLPEGISLSEAGPVKLRIGIAASGDVRFAMPDGEIRNRTLSDLASREVSKWRFEPKGEPEESELAEELEWGWVVVPWDKSKKSGTIKEDVDSEGIEIN